MYPTTSLAAMGDLDTTFGTDGMVTTDFNGNTDEGYSVVVQSDGKILVAGTVNNDFALTRYDSNGNQDTSFGTGGLVTMGSSDARAYSVAVQSDGKILVAGHNDGDFALTRYDSDGVLDTTFGGGDGTVITDFGTNSYGYSVAVQEDGYILVAGYTSGDFALARYDSDGGLDTSFGTGGMVVTDFASYACVYSMALQEDGYILVAGFAFDGSGNDFALARYDSSGNLDTFFGPDSNGKVTTDFGDGSASRSVAIQSDGKIVVVGQAFTGSNWDFALARYDIDGELDDTFGTGGMVTTNFGSGDEQGRSVAILDNGKIMVAGYTETGSDYVFALARYDSDGELDETFGEDGLATTNFGSGDAQGWSLTIQDDGMILVAGQAWNGSDDDFALARYIGAATPTVITASITDVTSSSATSGGTISSDGDLSLTALGVCWNTSGSPTTSDTCTSDAPTGASFTSSLTGLSQNTTYYLRAYATNSLGTAYGDEASFTTLGTPTVTTTTVTDITTSGASSGGTISSDGGLSVTARGVCWNTSGSPTLDDTCTFNGTGTGAFESSLIGLSASITYYVRAYAINSLGTAYGDEESFTATSSSAATTPSVATTTVTDITSSSAASGGNVTDDGGASVTARGVCWSTSGSPALDTDICSADGSGTGAFTSNLIALSASTTYYVRAYATNAAGTAYGGEESFTTSQSNGTSPGAPSVETGTPEPTSCTCATIPGNVTDEGGATVSQRGVCYTMVNDTATWCVSCSSSGGGSFSVELTELEPATQYTAYAYAVNSFGMGGGAVTTFTTPALHDHVLFFRNTGSGQTALIYFTGTTRQGYALSVQAGQVWQARDVEDFDQDNSPDTMWQNQETGQMVLVSMNSYLFGNIRGKGSYPEWSASACGDFNGDGHKDAAWRDSESGQVVAQLFENLEPVEIRNTLELSNLDWHLSTAGDFNNDGTDDLVFRNLQDGRVGIVLLEDAVYASAAYLPDVKDQTFSVVAALDMNLDGSTDIIWFDEIAGDLYVEYLSGVEHLHYGYLTHAPLEWIPFGGASYEK